MRPATRREPTALARTLARCDGGAKTPSQLCAVNDTVVGVAA